MSDVQQAVPVAWEGYRDKYRAMLPVPALPVLNARGGA
jgi:hypothetical protein